MSRLLSYAKCAGVVFGALFAFSFVWELFLRSVNPQLAEVAYQEGREVPAFHVLALDVIDFGRNYSLWLLWAIATFMILSWLSQKKEPRAAWRRIVVASYLAPFTAITILLIAASLV